MESWKKLDDTELADLEKNSKGIITISKDENETIAILNLNKIGKYKIKTGSYMSTGGIYKLEKRMEYYLYYRQEMSDNTFIDMALPFAKEEERQQFIDSKLTTTQRDSIKLVEKEIN